MINLLTIVKIKYRISRGQGWIYYVKDIVYVFVAIYAIEDILRRFGISDPILIKWLFITMPPLYFILCYIIGWFDEKKGIWKLESVYGSKDLNPYMERLNEMVKEIHNEVVKIDNNLMKEYDKNYERKLDEYIKKDK